MQRTIDTGTFNIKAFSLIELLIVILIIAFLTSYVPKHSCGNLGDAKAMRAKQDCDTFVQAVQKYNSLENTKVKDIYMIELNSKYIHNIDNLKDPWGNRYEQDYLKGVVYSKGPDGMHTFGQGWSAPHNRDDITVNYIGALNLIDAKLEVNPFNGNVNDTNEINKCYDILHLYFNKNVCVPVNGNLNLGSAAAINTESTTGDIYADEFTFRYYNNDNYKAQPLSTGAGSQISDLCLAANIPPASAKYSMAAFGNLSEIPYACYAWGADSKEIIIKFAAGYTCADPRKKLLLPHGQYINLTGAKNNKNKTFLEIGGSATSTPEDREGGEASGIQILIKPYGKSK